MQGVIFYLLPHTPSTIYTYFFFQDVGIHYSVQTSLKKDGENHCRQQVQALFADSTSHKTLPRQGVNNLFLLYYHSCFPFILISQCLAVGVLLHVQLCQHYQT